MAFAHFTFARFLFISVVYFLLVSCLFFSFLIENYFLFFLCFLALVSSIYRITITFHEHLRWGTLTGLSLLLNYNTKGLISLFWLVNGEGISQSCAVAKSEKFWRATGQAEWKTAPLAIMHFSWVRKPNFGSFCCAAGRFVQKGKWRSWIARTLGTSSTLADITRARWYGLCKMAGLILLFKDWGVFLSFFFSKQKS